MQMAHTTDSIGYPLDPELRQREFHLGDLAALWRGSYDDHERQQRIVQAYHETLAQLYRLGWDSVLDIESELPDALMPEAYMRRHGRLSSS
jgi:hypothetical protein